MEKKTLKERVLNEVRKKDFLKALSVFFFFSIIGVICGFIFNSLQLASTMGVGLGVIWMGVAYFNQEEKTEN